MLDVSDECLSSIPAHWKCFAITQLLLNWDWQSIAGDELFDLIVRSPTCERLVMVLEKYNVWLSFTLEELSLDDFVPRLYRLASGVHKTAVDPVSVLDEPR